MEAPMKSFKERRTFGQRVREVDNVKRDHPNKIPVIIERYAHENQLPPLDRSKFLIPEHVTVGEVIKILKRRLQLNMYQSIFLLVNGQNQPATTTTFAEIYRTEADPDGFLYIVYAAQEVFG
ncbi:unnamed protein product [Allacma fusca]|jgi:microtubule-associated protein 1 light chain|uniref:Autophagy-related protein n=1 Tax=Allacma fusca TaxID=39272 RepID=A0A8J2NYM5_9HEXA|nr:unnamed protein product [Allacma fusca]